MALNRRFWRAASFNVLAVNDAPELSSTGAVIDLGSVEEDPVTKAMRKTLLTKALRSGSKSL